MSYENLVAESGFATRRTLWRGVGVSVQNSPNSSEAMRLAGLDYEVIKKKIQTEDGIKIKDKFATIRSTDQKPLGIVGSKYHIIQNAEAFEFTDSLIGEGVTYESAGALRSGKVIWLLAKLPEPYRILGDEVEPYVVFTNSFDGSGSVRVACTPVRIACLNTLNLALRTAKRTWSIRHTKTAKMKIAQARQTLELTEGYMNNLQATFEDLYQIKMNKDRVVSTVEELIPIEENFADRKRETCEGLRSDIVRNWEAAPDLMNREETAARFIQAVADTASHKKPGRDTETWQENYFMQMANRGSDLVDNAMKLVQAVA